MLGCLRSDDKRNGYGFSEPSTMQKHSGHPLWCTLKNELLDKLPTCPHLQREPWIAQSAGEKKTHCGGGQQGSKAKGKWKAAVGR